MVPISPEIYSSTAVVMDNRSLADYIQRIEDRRLKRAAAEQEAVDNYVKEYNKNLTPTGMKTNDIPDFLQMQQEFRLLSNKYKSTKNPLDKLALDKKGDEMFLFINESKGAVEEAKQPTSALADPNKKNKIDFETLSRDLDLHNLPLRDPNRKKLGALSNYFYPEQFDEVGTFNEAAKGIKESELGTTIVKGQKIIPVGYNENAIKSIAENYLKLVDINPTATNYYKGKLKNLPAEKVAEAVSRVKKYYPKLEIDDDNPFFLKLSDAIKTAEQRTSQKIENVPRVSVSTGYGGGGQIQVTGNAFDEITNIKGIRKGVEVKDGIALLNSKPYNGKIVVAGEELPLSVVAPLKSAGLKISQKDKVDVVFQNGKVISIKPIGKSAVSKTMMENAQLKYSTEPQKGPQMIFGRSSGGGGAYLGIDENGNPKFEED